MDRFDDDTLLAELREIRPEPRSEFAAELDEWAAAGFPRRAPRPGAGRLATLAAHLRDLRAKSARQWLVPALGLTIAVLATVGVVVAIGSNGGTGGNLMTSPPAQEGGGAGVESEPAEAAGGEAIETESGGEEVSGPTEEESGVHNGEVLPKSDSKAQGAAGAPVEEAEGTTHGGEIAGGAEAEAEEGSVEDEPQEEPRNGFAPTKAGKFKTLGHRDVERSSSIVLGTKPDQVASAAAKVYAAVHAANGVVLSSSVESGSTGSSGASFSLLIPSGKVDDALAAFSRIAEVRSRHDATQDITKPTVGVTEELRDSNASIEGLLKELGSAETEAERESVEARLREERRRHASIRASLEHLHKRAAMSEVSLRIVTGHGAGAVPVGKGKSGGDWSVGDALRDAGHILTIVAGVALIGLAILAPFALIALLLWSLNRFRVRRLRERALG
ncbi:MAG TPA: DUF4349 domain-containing protein [Solirubrobacterales bacterium]